MNLFRMIRIFLLFLGIISLSFGCAQRKQTAISAVQEDPRWKPVDSLQKIGLYASALEITDSILGKAKQIDDWRTIFKAQMYRSRFRQMTGIDQELIIKDLEEFTASLRDDTLSPVPLRQLLHSVLGESYWNYYQQNRWLILDRTNVEDGGDATDISTWDQRSFMRQVVHHYQRSLQPFDTLRHIPAGELGHLLEWPLGSPRPKAGPVPERSGSFEEPLLMDILARRAIQVFSNSETRIAEPAWRFKLDDPRFFGLYEDFTQWNMHHRDSLAWEYQALRIWQEWEQAHLSDDHPIILTDVMLTRLAFVRRHSTLPEKDSLYYQALGTMRSRVEQLPVRSEVTTAMAGWHAERGERFQRLEPGEMKWEKRTAIELCDTAISRFPDSFGARKAAILKSQLLLPVINVHVEEAVIPEEAFKVALGYMNTTKVWLRIVEDVASVDDEYRRHDHLAELLKRQTVRQWPVELPDDGDHHRHIVEIPVEALPHGRFAILASTEENMRPKVDPITYASFWSTRIAVADRARGEELEALLLDRGTGKALSLAKAELFVMEYNSSGRTFTKKGEATADAEGRVKISLKNGSNSNRWSVSLPDGDRFITGTQWSYHHGQEQNSDSIRTFLFTDRAIYRPGQEVHFKGIFTVERGNTTVVKADRATIVKLYDANGQVTDSLELKSDAFGSFHGTFRAPGGLTGNMRIEEEHGSVNFLVEEYKRPKFEVVFDPIETTARLNEEATLTGSANSYAGVPLDNSQVRWTVSRSARMPWWSHGIGRGGWGGFPGWGRSVEIASGAATTDAEGNFQITFLAAPDRELPRRVDPIFTFTVEASVTDITGETQSNTTSLSLGYKSIEILLGIDNAIDRSTTDSLEIKVRNLNGQPVDRPVDVRISRLQEPMLPMRERKWEQPDRFVITREAHAALFPFDPYDQEADPLNWPTDSVVLEIAGWSSSAERLKLANIEDWPVGSYKIELKTTDPDGNEVNVEEHVTLFDPDIQNTGFLADHFHVEQLEPADGQFEPGEKARLLMSTALGEGRIGMEVERDGKIVASRWTTLHRGQQLVELPIQEEDRGGFIVNFIAVANGTEYRTSERIEVPWSNKQLKVEWMTFRDKMLPGAKEEFRLKISGEKGEAVAAQLLTTMYDASLDHFVLHNWEMFQWPQYHGQLQWSRLEPFGVVLGQHAGSHREMPRDTVRVYPELKTYGWPAEEIVMYDMMMDAEPRGLSRGRVANAESPAPPALPEEAGIEVQQAAKELIEETPQQQTQQPVRSDFRETAFFFPDLLTDQDGSVIISFTIPEALTRWKLMGLTHTADLQIGQFEREVVTQKPLMVMPNLPRFLREGDRIRLMSKINALEGDNINGKITLELFDPSTNASVGDRFALQDQQLDFSAAPSASGIASWTIDVPAAMDMVGIRIVARGDQGISDGEEHVLPILTDRMLVTESMPLWTSKAGTKDFTFEKIKNNTSTTLRHQSLKLEFTPNPAWYAVQALPYLIEFPHECSEQVFSRFYANTLAAHIVEERPGILQVVEAWRASAAQGGNDLRSALEKNHELKNIMLEETPWVMRARDEGERKERLILLFDIERMAREKAQSLQKLKELQLPDGSWPWFNGMYPSRSITQHIVAGMGHLQRLGAADLRQDAQVQQMLNDAIRWMDKEADKAFQELKKNSTADQLEAYVPGYTDLQYLYARSFFLDRPYSAGAAQAAAFIQQRINSEWLKYGLQEQAMIALALSRIEGQNSGTPMLILRSLKERSTRDEELGMYWKNFANGMSWNSFPTETHSLMVEAFHEVAKDAEAVNELRNYLLKLKQTTEWRTTKATANACYALLLTGSDLLEETPAPEITIGGEPFHTQQQEAGTGYFAHTWNAEKVKPDMGEVSITTTTDRIAWGALHWQYFEQMDKITPHESPFNIRKEVMLRRQTEEGARLLTLEQAGSLQVGDRLTIRIELRTDRYVDFVHLKDLRAAGLEPVEVLSGHKWQGGLGYYQSIKDAGIHFFFDRIPPGTHVFEYDLNVSHVGNFSNGITSAMCMYAPEFSSHSAGQRIDIGIE